MKNIVSTYVDRFLHERRTRLRLLAVFIALAAVVTVAVFWRLHYTGIAMTNEVYCGMEEHTHDESCYEQVLVCGMEEGEKDAVYDEDGVLISGSEDGHVHTDDCYETVLTCTVPEHTHTVECLVDEEADVETAADWEATLPGNLTGVWADDVVAVAESQIGYEESEKNFRLAEDGTTRQGYTRYGAWYGNEYGDWDAMFASFCLHYAGISKSDFPENSGAYAWAVELKKDGLYADVSALGADETSEDVVISAGDLVFLDNDGDSKADTVAVIIKISDNTLTVVQGDSNDAVEKYSINMEDTAVVGYGILPEQPGVETTNVKAMVSAQGAEDDTYDPYGTNLLDDEDDSNYDYVIEVGQAIYLTGTYHVYNTWSYTSADSGSVSFGYTGSGRYHNWVTGTSPGVVTVTHAGATGGTDTWTIKVSDTIRVYVYACGKDEDGNVFSTDMLDLLGIDVSTLDANGYFPVGEIELPYTYFSNKGTSGGLITSADDWPALIEALGSLDTSYLTDEYLLNQNNNMSDYTDEIIQDIGAGSGSEMSALIYWGANASSDDASHDNASNGYSDATVRYHLDIRFYTYTITFENGHNGIDDQGGANDEVIDDTHVYIRNAIIQEPRNITIPDGYKLVGYYSDYECTIPWDGIGTPITADKTVYVKIAPIDYAVIYYQAIGDGGTVSPDSESFDVDENPTGSTADVTDTDYEFAGWYDNEECEGTPVGTKLEFTPTEPDGGWSSEEAYYYYAKFELKPYTVTVTKVDADNGNITLSGAGFLLYYEDTEEGSDTPIAYYYNEDKWVKDQDEAQTLTTNRTGTVSIPSLTAQKTYYLKEVTAPDGYNLLSAPITFKISNGTITSVGGDGASSSGLTLTVTNYAGAMLPNTGGSGTILYTLAGLLLMGGAAYLLYRNTRRRKESIH